MNSTSLENMQENPRFANLIACIQEVNDFRSEKNKVYSLECIVIMAICAVLGGANNCTEIADFIANRSEYYMPLFNLKDRTPSHDVFSDVFSLVITHELEFWLTLWLEGAIKEDVDQVDIDGKVQRAYSSDDPLCVVRGWANKIKMVLGSVRVDAGSNEITAIPKLLEQLCLKGKLVTIDAIGAQKNIVSKIRAHGADYLITLKGN